MLNKTTFCLLLFFGSAAVTRGQGCSDAGFCTMGAMRPDQSFGKRIQLRLRSAELTFYRGVTTLTPVITSVTTDLNFSLNAKNSLQVKLPYQWVRGKLGETEGVGDLSLCLTRLLFSGQTWNISASLGTKIPTNYANKTSDEGLPLPMYYQTSLGSYDGIFGASAISRKWLLATGIQIPFTNNYNQFLWGKWSSRPDLSEYVRKYDRGQELNRGYDIMARVERNFRFSQFNASLGLLPIWRLQRDVFTGPTGDRVKTNGSTGVAFTALATAGYNLNAQTGFKLLYGKNIHHRGFNPDGLTRESVITVTFTQKF